MRFIGSKRSLLQEIDKALSEVVTGEEEVFCDLFAGTGVVAEYFKPRYTILSNDMLHFSYVLQKASLENNTPPSFLKLKEAGIADPFFYLLNTPVSEKDASFLYHNYAPTVSSRRYFTPENALRIDFIRNAIADWRQKDLIDEKEYYYLLAALLEGIPYASNITGTYGAFLKHWDSRALAPLKLLPREVIDNGRENKSFCEDANQLIRRIKGDILYLDPPYNSRQYLPNYHILETVSRWDFPAIKGVTGVRPYKEERSAYCSRKKARDALEELIRLADFTHILLSYSAGGILPADEIERILKKYGQPFTYRRIEVSHDKYRSKGSGGKVDEYLFYIRKKPFLQRVFSADQGDQQLLLPSALLQEQWARVATPFRYNGNKYRQLDELFCVFPSSCRYFVDLFCGSCAVAANFPAEKTLCNDKNHRLIQLLSAIRERDEKEILDQIDRKMRYYDLNQQNEAGYHAFREDYNRNPDPIDLYLLSCYSFNYQLRFNSRMEYNNSFGRDRSHFTPRMRRELIRFRERLRQMDVTFTCGDFSELSLEMLGENDLIYCDPPYLSTTGSYNDGNRGPDGWSEQDEQRLMDFLTLADQKGIPFVMTNVLEYQDGRNEALLQWSEKYNVLPFQAHKGQLKEVIISNR